MPRRQGRVWILSDTLAFWLLARFSAWPDDRQGILRQTIQSDCSERTENAEAGHVGGSVSLCDTQMSTICRQQPGFSLYLCINAAPVRFSRAICFSALQYARMAATARRSDHEQLDCKRDCEPVS